MVYVCITCLYFGDNEKYFKKIECVVETLALFVPEINSIREKYFTILCEQCYFFLKNVESFKTKCLETQKKLNSSCIETLKDAHQIILQSSVNEVHLKKCEEAKSKRNYQEYSLQSLMKRSKSDLKISAVATSYNGKTNKANQPGGNKPAHNSQEQTNLVAEDLLNCGDENLSNGKNDELIQKEVSSFNKNDLIDEQELFLNYEDDEYLAERDLVDAGNLSDDERLGSSSGDDSNIMDGWMDENDNDCMEEQQVELREDHSLNDSQYSLEPPECAPRLASNMIIKMENKIVDENPGFFNKRDADGYYKCRLCGKQYKTSSRLYGHTKQKHSDAIKFHHCNLCSFFTIWKSSLRRHISVFHQIVLDKNVSRVAKCYHCSFKTRLEDKLRLHMINHI